MTGGAPERSPEDGALALAATFGGAEAERVAVRCGEVELDRRTLDRRIERLAEGLARLPPDSRVGLYLRNDPAFVVALLAALRAGRVVVPFDPRWTETERRGAMERVPVSLWLHAEPSPRLDFDPGRRSVQLDRGGEILTADLPEAEGTAAATPEPGDLAIEHWSSGSTGLPKPIAVVRSALAFRFAGLVEGFGLGPGDRMLCFVPASHAHGIDSIVLPTLASGAELILLEPTEATPERVVAEVERWGVAAMSALPFFYESLLRTDASAEAFGTLRLPLCGSAALADGVADRFHERFGRRIVTGYGLTEAGTLCMNRHAEEPLRLRSVGRCFPGVEYRVDPAREGEGGSLWVRSPGLAQEPTDGDARRWVDGWLDTEDLVEIDDGYITLVGRRSRFINVDGSKVDPREIEEAILGLAWVETAAVVGATEGGRERIAAHVTLLGAAPDRAEHEVRAHLAGALALHKVPETVRIWDELPRNSLGKVLYARLRQAGTAPAEPAAGEDRANAAEGAVAEIWREVLNRHAIGLDDPFADLGGTSLQITQLQQRLEERFRREIGVVELFRHPTVRAQAAYLSGDRVDPADGLRQARERGRRRREAGKPPRRVD